MSLAVIHSRAQVGIEAPPVTVEVHLAGGLPSLSIVGLPETAVKESKDRVRAALQNSGFEFPARRITISLAPADLPKDGGRFDLPIALGILAASGQVSARDLERYEFLGELSLGGDLRGGGGVLPAALAVADAGRRLVVPAEDAGEAALIKDGECFAADSLLQVCHHLNGAEALPVAQPISGQGHGEPPPDLADVRGQRQARRALEIAAAGGHNLLLVGPPGTGKTKQASRLPGILPPMADREALEAAAVESITGRRIDPANWRRRRFRAPHHTASGVALVGGGPQPRPGEISLAHNGVLFLDELPEFDRRVLEVLREPMESGTITISRAARQAEFPARFQLIAAMNPCPCGYAGDSRDARCRCTPDQIQRYRGRVSGPLLDRIDLQIYVPRLPTSALSDDQARPENSVAVRKRVSEARERQAARGPLANAAVDDRHLHECCRLSHRDQRLLDQAVDKLSLSTRGARRILRVARTIADLSGRESIDTADLTEAIGYRRMNLG